MIRMNARKREKMDERNREIVRVKERKRDLVRERERERDREREREGHGETICGLKIRDM